MQELSACHGQAFLTARVPCLCIRVNAQAVGCLELQGTQSAHSSSLAVMAYVIGAGLLCCQLPPRCVREIPAVQSVVTPNFVLVQLIGCLERLRSSWLSFALLSAHQSVTEVCSSFATVAW